MTFGWQGFTLEHPEDWGPTSLTGARREGYARLSSPGRLAFQLRWKQVKSPGDLRERLNAYLDSLERDAKRAKTPFRRESEAQEERLIYRYSGVHHGRGALFYSEACGRIVFLEVVSTQNDSLLTPFRQLLASFRSEGGEGRETWAVLGLRVRLPKGLIVDRRQFQAGRTRLSLHLGRVQVDANRWGFAEQLVQRHGLEAWARGALEMPGAESAMEPEGLRLREPGGLLKPRREALALVDYERNQITTLAVAGRSEEWRPEWDWLTS